MQILRMVCLCPQRHLILWGISTDKEATEDNACKSLRSLVDIAVHGDPAALLQLGLPDGDRLPPRCVACGAPSDQWQYEAEACHVKNQDELADFITNTALEFVRRSARPKALLN